MIILHDDNNVIYAFFLSLVYGGSVLDPLCSLFILFL